MNAYIYEVYLILSTYLYPHNNYFQLFESRTR